MKAIQFRFSAPTGLVRGDAGLLLGRCPQYSIAARFLIAVQLVVVTRPAIAVAVVVGRSGIPVLLVVAGSARLSTA